MHDRSLTIFRSHSGTGTDTLTITIYQHGTELHSFPFGDSLAKAIAWAKSIGYQDIHYEGFDEPSQ